MENEATKVVYYKRNVPYTVVVRFHQQDAQGFALNRVQPWVGVPTETLRDFKMANKRAIMDGVIVETTEPSVDWDTPNALTDEAIDELLKSYLKLKSTVAGVDSAPILAKMLERAKDQNKSNKIISIIQNKLDEIVIDEGIITAQDMQGVS
jgi:hypothetical protein